MTCLSEDFMRLFLQFAIIFCGSKVWFKYRENKIRQILFQIQASLNQNPKKKDEVSCFKINCPVFIISRIKMPSFLVHEYISTYFYTTRSGFDSRCKITDWRMFEKSKLTLRVFIFSLPNSFFSLC